MKPLIAAAGLARSGTACRPRTATSGSRRGAASAPTSRWRPSTNGTQSCTGQRGRTGKETEMTNPGEQYGAYPPPRPDYGPSYQQPYPPPPSGNAKKGVIAALGTAAGTTIGIVAGILL